MPRLRSIFIILFTAIMTGLFLVTLIVWRHIGMEADGTRKAYIYLVSIVFALLITLFAIVLYNFDQRKRAERRYRESETKFSLLVRNVRDLAIFMVDPAGRVMSWNKGAERIKGYKEEEIVGKPIDVFYLPEDLQRGEPANNLKRAREDGRYESLGWRTRKGGSVFYADVLITPLYDDQGELRGYAKITRDITEKKKAEENVQRAFHREHELNEMKSRFVSMASHEFKTPLSVILSSASLLEKYQGPADLEKRARHLQRI
ncbi:MAG TPA: PAS domain S-box protein, partial [Puia sp.]|nr:PAS domain S-box protein [Puia sp.]